MKKFLLVPNHALPSPLTKKLNQLDEEMKQILTRDDLGEATKAKLYSDTLSKYLDVRNQLQQPHQVPIFEQEVKRDESKQPVSQPPFPLSSIPKNYRARAENLLSHIQDRTNMSWNDRMELMENNKPVPRSNVIDLVRNYINPNSKVNSTEASARFSKNLRESNVPEYLRGTKDYHDPYETPPSTPTGRMITRLEAGLKKQGGKGYKWESFF